MTEQETKVTELVVIQHDDNLYIDSRVIAEYVDKRHDHLVRDIRKYIDIISTAPNLGALNYFVESSYTDNKGEQRICYLCTKKGCDMIAHKMTGEKGILFTAAYIEKFYAMEEQLRNNVKILSPLEILKQQVQIMEEQQRQLQQNTEDIKDIRKYHSASLFHQQKINKDIQTRLSQHDQDISGIKQTLSGAVSPREEIKNVVNLAVKKYNMEYQEVYRIIYEQIEENCKINLSDRLNKLKKRLQNNGATKSKIDGATKLDAIDQDPGIWKLIFEVLDILRRYIETDK